MAIYFEDTFTRSTSGIGDARYDLTNPLSTAHHRVNGSQFELDLDWYAEHQWLHGMTYAQKTNAIYSFDFYVPTNLFNSSSIRIFTSDAVSILFDHYLSNEWSLFANELEYYFTPDPGTFYTVKVNYQEGVFIGLKVWRTDSAEPAAWAMSSATPDPASSFLDRFDVYAPFDEKGYVDNLRVVSIDHVEEPEPEPEPEPEVFFGDSKKKITIVVEGRRNKQQILKDFIRPSPANTTSAPRISATGGTRGADGHSGSGNCIDFTGGALGLAWTVPTGVEKYLVSSPSINYSGDPNYSEPTGYRVNYSGGTGVEDALFVGTVPQQQGHGVDPLNPSGMTLQREWILLPPTAKAFKLVTTEAAPAESWVQGTIQVGIYFVDIPIYPTHSTQPSAITISGETVIITPDMGRIFLQPGHFALTQDDEFALAWVGGDGSRFSNPGVQEPWLITYWEETEDDISGQSVYYSDCNNCSGMPPTTYPISDAVNGDRVEVSLTRNISGEWEPPVAVDFVEVYVDGLRLSDTQWSENTGNVMLITDDPSFKVTAIGILI